MQEIDVTETATTVEVTHRAVPSLLRVAMFSAALAFTLFVLANVDLSQASWLPPFDRLPALAKQALIVLSIGGGLAIIVLPIVRGLTVLLLGEPHDQSRGGFARRRCVRALWRCRVARASTHAHPVRDGGLPSRNRGWSYPQWWHMQA